MARYLVVAHQTAGSPELRNHVSRISKADPGAEFGIVVPATPVSHLFTWSEEETHDIARHNLETSASLLRDAGANVTRTVIGSRFPLEAIADELREHPDYDEIIICTFPPGVSRWLKRDLLNQARKRTGLPVSHVVARPGPRQPAAVSAAPRREARDSSGAAVVSPAREAPAPIIDLPPRDVLSEEEVGHLDLPYIERDDLPEDERELWDRLIEGRDVPNVFRVMGHNRPLLQSYVEMLNTLWNESGLDDQTREMAILRVALLQRSEYLWHQHVPIARGLGLDDEIPCLEHWQSSELVRFDERQRAVLSYVDAVARDRRPPASVHECLNRYYPLTAIVGVALVVGFYRMTGSFATALGVEPEGRFVGWHLY